MFGNRFIIVVLIGALAVSACNMPQPASGVPSPDANGEAPVTLSSQPLVQNTPATSETAPGGSYPIVDTNQTNCYGFDNVITCPNNEEAFAGKDGNYQGLAPSYQNNGQRHGYRPEHWSDVDKVTRLKWRWSD